MSSTTFFFIFIPVLSILLLSINLILAPHKPYQEKKSVFECGFSSFRGMNRKEFIVSFFLFGLLFISFDMELVATFPFATSAYNSSTYSVVVVILFLLVLTLGFVFELGKNALVIDSRQTSSYNDVETPPSHAFLASSNEAPLEPNSLNSLPLKSTLDPMGLIANAAHVVASADCLHATREYLTMSTSEILKGQYPMCDFNPINGVQHSVLNLNNRTFAYCTSCLSVICAKCDLSQGSQSSQAFMLITSCNIFKTLLFNTKEYIFSVFGKNRSVAPYILIVLSCFIVFLCNDFSVTYVDLVPFFSMTVVCRSPENDITGKGSSGDPAKDLCSARDDGNHVFEHTVPQDSKPGDDTTVDCSNCDENIDLLSESARICIQCADTYCTPCFSNLDVKCDASRAWEIYFNNGIVYDYSNFTIFLLILVTIISTVYKLDLTPNYVARIFAWCISYNRAIFSFWINLFTNKIMKYISFNTNYIINPHSFESKPLQSDMGISEIVAEINTFLPQLANFINQFSTTVSQEGVNVVTDSTGNMSIDIPKSMTDDAANKISTKIGIIDRLIITRGQEINDLLQKGISLENKLKIEDPHYVSQLTDKIQEFKRLNALYKH